MALLFVWVKCIHSYVNNRSVSGLYFFLLNVFLILNKTNGPNIQEQEMENIWDPCDTMVNMAFIKEEIEDVNISETFIVKNEDAEDDTGWFISYWFICLLFFMLAFKQI